MCAVDSFCCNVSWDDLCVNQVETVAGGSCAAQTDVGIQNLCDRLWEADAAEAGAEEDEIFARCGDDNVESLPPVPFGAHYPQDQGTYIVSDSPDLTLFCGP